MKKSDYIVRLLWLATAAIITIALAVLFYGCSSIRKLKKNVKQTEQIKTTEQSNKATDSSTTTVVKKVDSSGTTVTVVFDNDGKDTATDVEITTYSPHKEDDLTNRKVGVKTNRTPKSITVNQATKKADEQAVATNVKTNEAKAVTSEKKVVNKDKGKDIKKVRFQWWIVIIPLVIVLLILLILWGAFGITPLALWNRFKSLFTKKPG